MQDQLNEEQRQALEAYAKKYGEYWKEHLNDAWCNGRDTNEPNGEYWKEHLNDAWCNGRDTNEPNGYLLRQVRNNLGPEWLITFEL